MKVSRSTIGWASLSLLALAGCPVTGDDLCAGGTCGAAAASGDAATPQDAGADAIIEQPTDPCVDKPDAPECLTNESALFVSPTANPAGADGTLEHPFATITTAVQKVTNAKRRIYVCEGTYAEQVALETLPMTLIGGFTCDFRGKGAKPKIAPPSGVALSIAAVGGTSLINVVVEGTTAPNTPGASAIGIFVTRAKNILLRGVDVTVTAGQAGANGVPKTNWSGLQKLPNGPSGTNGGGPPECVKCTDATYSYAGGGGSTGGGFPEGGAASPPVNGVNAPNYGSNAPTCTSGTGGANGEPAPKATGAERPGVLQQSAWNTEATSKPGGNGGPAQGGGGGGANTLEGGGSGGCGGCGGAGGPNGSNGGSSIAILVYNSELRIEKSALVAGNGGKGGDGAKGQDGQAGRAGGVATCVGGTGGGGAGGGGGGGGAGGHSLAIGYLGDEPQRSETTLAKGSAGPAGLGGDPGASPGGTAKAGFAGDPGKEGRSEEVLDLE